MTRFFLFMFAVSLPLAAFADPTTNTLTLQKNLTSSRGWGIVNPAAVGLLDPTNVWPATVSVDKTLVKAAASLAKTTFTCTVTWDPDFRIPGHDADYLYVTKVKSCQ
jgi:hypothetical protein